MSKSYFNLTRGGAGILQAASRIYAAYVTSGRVPEGKEKEWMRRALKHAMSFAKTIDDLDDSPKDAAAIAVGAAVAASADPDDTAGHGEPADSTNTTETPSTENADDGAGPDDTGIELSASFDKQAVSDDDVLAAIMDDQPESSSNAVSSDPTSEMMDELHDSGHDMVLDADDDSSIAATKKAAASEITPTDSESFTSQSGDTKPEAISDNTESAKSGAAATSDDELDIDENVMAAFADTGLATEEDSAKPADKSPANKTPADKSPADADSSVADEAGEAIEFLSTLADELPPSTEEPAGMDDIMSALTDDAAEPASTAKQPDAADQTPTKPEIPLAIDDAEEPIPIARGRSSRDANTEKDDFADAKPKDDQQRSNTAGKSDQAATGAVDEQTSPTEADLAATHLDDDLSFELVDEDIDMNKLIEDAISATEKKEVRDQ